MSRKFYQLLIGLLISCYGLFCWAQAPAENTEEIVDVTPGLGPDSVDFTWLFLKTLLAMAVVLALAIIILRFVLPRLSLHRTKRMGRGSEIQVLERYPLDAKKVLYVIEVEGKRLLLGSGEQTVNLISELSGETSTSKEASIS